MPKNIGKQHISLSEKWLSLQPKGVDEFDLFEIIEKGENETPSSLQTAKLEDLPPAFFDFFMVIKAS